MATTLAELAEQRLSAGGHAPAVTAVDLGRGERTELSHATLHNWVSKTANLLVDDLAVAPGDRVGLGIGDHWAAAVVAWAAWRAGAVVLLGTGPARVAVLDEEADEEADAETVLLVGRGMAGRLTRPAAHDGFTDEVLPHGDHFADLPLAPDTAALEADGRTWTHGELLDAAAAAPVPGGRVASTLPLDTTPGLVAGLVGPLLAGGSLVLILGGAPEGVWGAVVEERAAALLSTPAAGPALHAAAPAGAPALHVLP
jgi:uncharacterized protein (TIGR03089 family)